MSVAVDDTPREVAAFRALFDEHFDYVLRSLRRLGVLERDAEDVAQEVFMLVLRKLATYDTQRPIRPWLFAFAARSAANYRRLGRVRHEHAEADHAALAPTAVAPGDLAREHGERQLVLDALQGVAEDRRSAFIMYEIDGFTANEVADVLEIPVNTVYSRIRLARAEFRTSVAELQRGENA